MPHWPEQICRQQQAAERRVALWLLWSIFKRGYAGLRGGVNVSVAPKIGCTASGEWIHGEREQKLEVRSWRLEVGG